jgi:hypothetical protein
LFRRSVDLGNPALIGVAPLAFVGQGVPKAHLNPGLTLRDHDHLKDFGVGSDLRTSLDLVL